MQKKIIDRKLIGRLHFALWIPTTWLPQDFHIHIDFTVISVTLFSFTLEFCWSKYCYTGYVDPHYVKRAIKAIKETK